MSHGIRTIGLWCLSLVLIATVPLRAAATETTDLTFVEASCRDAYLEVAGVWGLEIGFDHNFKGWERVTMKSAGPTF